ncbi:MAG: hypothetical protein DMF78_05605 [Acidobacteria bacterium]|nr:MAG: hypothetical protein DMF78_05605 [Acidobacteriota bacterium]
MLERAARLRPDPGTNVITYGTNRLDRYHPYLRLAEAYLMAGQPDKAQDALRRSTARGKEPADERARLAAQVETALEKTRVAAAAPPTTLAAVPPPATVGAATTVPPTTIAAAPAPPATSAVARVPSVAPAAAPRAAASGRLDLRSEPAGATVLLGDRLLGTTPLQVELAPGDYTVTLRKEGTADASFPVRIGPGKATVETRTLVATAPAAAPSVAPPEIASLIVYSQPPGARVYLDDEPLGATDPRSGRLVKSGVAPGAHRVRLAGDGLADAVEDVAVPEHGPATLRIQLTPSTSLRASGLTWTVVAAAWAALLVAGAWAWRRRRAAAGAAAAAEAPRATVGLPATPMPSATVTRTPAGARATLDGRGATAAGPGTSTESGSRETTALPTPARPASGPERFGEFRLLEPLGKGGMAAVFKAERRGEVCALKRPLAAFLEDPEFLERFLREAEIGRTLHHPNIIRIFERGDVDGLPYFTMELVKGETLAARVRARGALEARAGTDVIAQVAEVRHRARAALRGAHRDRRLPGHARLRGPGDGGRQGHGRAQRPVLAGHRVLRDPDRQAAVRGRHALRHAAQARLRAAHAALRDRARRPARAGGHHPEAAGQESRRPLSGRGRAADRPAGVLEPGGVVSQGGHSLMITGGVRGPP